MGFLRVGRKPSPYGLSKRSSINMNLMDIYNEYKFIDHVLEGGSGVAPVDAFWYAPGNQVWNRSILDANGWPNNAVANGRSFGNHITVPSSTNYATYVIKWTGKGRLTLAGTWTETFTSGTDYVKNANGDWSGEDITIEATYSGSVGQLAWRVMATDPDATGTKYFRNLKIYRKEDETDLNAGLIFRVGFKQPLVDLNPSCIRVMNWTGHNDAQQCRFEDRNLPSYATYGGGNPRISPPYGETSTANLMTLPSASGMPVSLTHGEVVQCRIGSGMVRGGAKTVTNITNANPGVVTCPAHGFNTDDVIVHQLSIGMTELDYWPVTITKLDDDNYSIGVNTTSFSPWILSITKTGNTTNGSSLITNLPNNTGLVSGSVQSVSCPSVLPANEKVVSFTATQCTITTGTGVTASTGATFTFERSGGTAQQYISLDVGLRGAYPVIFSNGTTPGSTSGNNYIRAGDYKTFFFDKTLTASKDGSGDPVYGVWLFSTSSPQTYLPYFGGVPLEICTALVNELNALSLSQGITNVIDLWITIPHRALLSMDPDYLQASNPAIGAMDVVLNGANGYAGLVERAKLFVEFTNENWNFGFTQTGYLGRRGVLRDPANGAGTSYMHSVRSTVMVKDIRAVFGSTGRIKTVLCGQGSVGIAASSTNYNRAFGATGYNNDALYDGANPVSHHDAWGFASYFLAGSTFDTSNLATMAAAWNGHAGDAVAQEADCAAYVAGVVGGGGSETVNAYITHLTNYANAFAPGGTAVLEYEGGWDRAITGTSPIPEFLTAVKKSQAWSDAMIGFFDAWNSVPNAFMPADYLEVEQRWGHAYIDTYSGGVEGAGLDLTWQNAGVRNRALTS